jgi:hypothetical protein
MSIVSTTSDPTRMNPPARMQPPEERCPSNQEHMIFARNAQSHPLLLVAASMEAPSRRAMVTCCSHEAVHCASCSNTRVSLDHKVDELKLSEEHRRRIVVSGTAAPLRRKSCIVIGYGYSIHNLDSACT